MMLLEGALLPTHRAGLVLLLIGLSSAASLLDPRGSSAGEEPNPRLERYRKELREAIPLLSSDEGSERLAALRTVEDALSWKGAGMYRLLEPLEDAGLAKATLDEVLRRLRTEPTGGSARFELLVLQLISGHSPETRRVVALRSDELVPLFRAVDERGLSSLLSAVMALGEAGDVLSPHVAAVLNGDDRTLSRQAGFTLGSVAGARARAALAEASANGTGHVRSNALRGWRFVDVLSVPEVRALLAIAEEERGKELGALRSCVYFGGSIEDEPKAVSALVREIRYKHLIAVSDFERRAACVLLGAIGEPAGGVKGSLTQMTSKDQDRFVRMAAFKALCLVAPSENTATRLMNAIEHPVNEHIRRRLVKRLRGIRAHALHLVPRLERLAESTDDESLSDDIQSMIWEIERSGLAPKPVLTLAAGKDRVRALAWSPDGERLAAGCEDRTLRIWRPTAREPVASHVLPRYG